MIEFETPADHPRLPGHFPGQPIVPGVVVLDHVLAAIESRHGALGALKTPAWPSDSRLNCTTKAFHAGSAGNSVGAG